MNIELLQMKAGQNAKSRGKLSTHFALLDIADVSAQNGSQGGRCAFKAHWWPAVCKLCPVLRLFGSSMQDLVLAESKAALAREAAARRKLHNLVQELRGNIRVFVRVKPADARGKGAPVLACEDGQRIACTAAGATKARRLFACCACYGSWSTSPRCLSHNHLPPHCTLRETCCCSESSSCRSGS